LQRQAKFPVFPVELGISPIFPVFLLFGGQNSKQSEVLASQFP